MFNIESFIDLFKNRYFITLLLFTIATPLLGSWFISSETFVWFEITTSNDWISFSGSYLGGIIGGLFTLLGVLLTLKRQNEQYIKTQENQLEQDKKVSTYQFENTLFRLIDLQNESINHLKLENHVGEWVVGKQAFDWLTSEVEQIKDEILIEDFKEYGIKIDEQIGYHLIKKAYGEIYSKYGYSLDHYIRNIIFILKSIKTVESHHLKENYLSILKAQLTQSELQTIFYISISIDEMEELHSLLKSTSFFSVLSKSLIHEDYHLEIFNNLDKFKNNPLDEISLFLDYDFPEDDSEVEEFLRGIEEFPDGENQKKYT
ncbi:putative phage abortive infection protein [Mesobacillus harenae]|uniref:putative phage abortive infection protein n=1 Tax=Mesobacillus harenae TaxID=2213203 RepID=UPI0015802793